MTLTDPGRDPDFLELRDGYGPDVRRCMQCGTCTASCPASSAMDLTPRRMWRLVQLGFVDEVLQSKTMWLCSLCYLCQVRCPRGIRLTDLITRLKEMALARGLVSSPQSAGFYEAFAAVMRQYGRMREVEFMARYLLTSNRLRAVGYAPLGLSLLRHGKIRLEVPSFKEQGRLDRLFRRVAEVEAEG